MGHPKSRPDPKTPTRTNYNTQVQLTLSQSEVVTLLRALVRDHGLSPTNRKDLITKLQQALEDEETRYHAFQLRALDQGVIVSFPTRCHGWREWIGKRDD